MTDFEFCNLCQDYATTSDSKGNPLCEECFDSTLRVKTKGHLVQTEEGLEEKKETEC